MKYAYIFDFDGVLVETMEAHFASYKQALEEVNVPIDKKQFFSQAGMKGVEQIKCFADKAGVNVDPAEIYARKREIWADHKDRILPIENNIQLLKLLRKAGCPVGIASGSSLPSILPAMDRFDISVDAIIAAEDVERGKPFPDLFLKAAEKLGVPPESCIVVEDSDAGVAAAKAAGMKIMRFYDKVN